MDGEFRVWLKEYNIEEITKVFIESYGNNLVQAFAKSEYQKNSAVTLDDFCAGYHTKDSLFLVYNREGNFLKVYVEPANKKDLNHMRDLINRYFKGVTDMLDKKDITWSKPQATITLEECPLTGVYKKKSEYLKDIFDNQREKLFIVPLGTVLATCTLVHFNITSSADAGKDWEKAVTSTLEAFFAFVFLLLGQWILTVNKRAFTFKI
jgi:hypothetical protein